MPVISHHSGGLFSLDKTKQRKGARVPAADFPNGPIEGDIFWHTGNKILYVWDGSSWVEVEGGAEGSTGVTHHGNLTGLANDDHPQYNHPNLATHDTMGLATDAELAAHAATPGHTHPNLATHDAMGLATDAELAAHAATSHGEPHPNLATHDAMGLATDDELATHAAEFHGEPHPDLAAHDAMGLATDADLTTAISNHETAADPHPVYATDDDLAAHAATSHDGEPHPDLAAHDAMGLATDAELAAHEAAADPHTVYQKESEKGAASGYAALGGNATVPLGQLATGSPGFGMVIKAHDTGASWMLLSDADIPDSIARDTEVTAAITAHESAGDPHPVYETSAEVNAKITAHENAADPHPVYATDDDLDAHAATSHGEPHPDLAAHDAMGLATDDELATHAATFHGEPHPDLAAHDAMGLATDAELAAHAATPHGNGGGPISAEDVAAGTFPTGTFTFSGDKIQFPSILSDNKINLYSDTYSIGVRSNSMVFRTGGTTGTDKFRFEQSDGTFLASIYQGASGPLARIGSGYYGMHPVHGASWASFGHWDRQGTNEYQFLAHLDGQVLINAGGTGQMVRIFINAAQRIAITNTLVTISNVPLTVTDGDINITGNNALRFSSHGGGWFMSDSSWVRTVGNKGIHTNDLSGAGNARMGNWGGGGGWVNFHHANLSNAGGGTYCLMVNANGQVIVNSNNGPLYLRQNGGGAAADLRVTAMPELNGGQNVWIVTASWQLGRQPSHFASKRDLRDVDWGNDNPLWKWKVHRFHWNERVGNADEENARVPDGFTGLVAEEVHATAPDAVVPGPDGEPTGFDSLVLLGYVVDSIQSLERRITNLEREVKT